ncbi:hypothetical protein GCM10009846_08230 [Agrococcus versicolor]|uniref:Uncharacterized protein n=1 Tax=Agrococcus versicolor TaxID=501482 RepID=A0ABP5MGF0_9MICO
MGVNVAVVVVRGARVAELAPLGYRPTGMPIPGDVAASSRAELSAMQHGANVVLLDAGFAWIDLAERAAQALARPVATALFGSVSDTWLFQLDVPGRATRRIAWSQGALADDTGARLPEEPTGPLDEERLGTLLARVTGFPGDTDWLAASWQPLTFPDPA